MRWRVSIQGRRQAVKAPGFDPGMRRFESFRPCQFPKGPSRPACRRWSVAKVFAVPSARSSVRPEYHRHGQSGAESNDAGRTQFAGVFRQRQPAAGQLGVQGTRGPPGQGAGQPLLRWRGADRDRGKRPRPGRVRDPAHLRPGGGEPDGAAGAGRRAEARLGRHGDRGGAVLRLRPPGPAPALFADADHGQGGGVDVQCGAGGPGADRGPAASTSNCS